MLLLSSSSCRRAASSPGSAAAWSLTKSSAATAVPAQPIISSTGTMAFGDRGGGRGGRGGGRGPPRGGGEYRLSSQYAPKTPCDYFRPNYIPAAAPPPRRPGRHNATCRYRLAVSGSQLHEGRHQGTICDTCCEFGFTGRVGPGLQGEGGRSAVAAAPTLMVCFSTAASAHILGPR